jgi:hypothetical protein
LLAAGRPCRSPYRLKKPVDDDWQLRGITVPDAPRYFNGEAQNVGVQLGKASGGLTDVDLDTIEAGLVALYFLLRTLCFGRASKPRSHWLYLSDLCETEDKAAIQHKFISGNGKERTEKMILELRIGGGGKALKPFSLARLMRAARPSHGGNRRRSHGPMAPI